MQRCMFLLSYDIRATLVPYPDFVDFTRWDVDSRARTKGFLLVRLLLGIAHCEVAREDEMCGQTIMGMWSIVSISRAHS